MQQMYLIYICLYIGYQLEPAWSQPDGSPLATCNACCQGPAGLPGVPGAAGAAGAAGTPGNNGLPGRDGIRGEAGSKGDVGERGERGEPGLPGPLGPSAERVLQGVQGFPGKVGPVGVPGINGSDGKPGPVGNPGSRGGKGRKGEAGGQRRSAFSVAKTSHQIGLRGDTLTFDVVETNIGNHYSTSTHKFTCQIPGTYVFMFTISASSYISDEDPAVDLYKDDYLVARAIVRETDVGGAMHLQGSQGVVLQLAEGNKVWLQYGSNGKRVHGGGSKPTTFAGFLIYED